MKKILLYFLILNLCSCALENDQGSENTNVKDPLPSWNDGNTKSAILNYVKEITNSESENFIPVSERIATFDNDGNLWSEQPLYFQLFFAMDRIKALSSEHPEWQNQQPYQAILENDKRTIASFGIKDILQIVMSSHSGNTTDEFDGTVKAWLDSARHPVLDKPYLDLVYQPMLELIKYLQENNFKTFIVSGGGVEFMRPWVEDTYGIPRDQVIGSSIKTEYDYNDGNPIIKRLPEIDFIDDKEGKPEGINRFIGRKPIFASGNSDGDLQMMRWAASNKWKSFMLFVHHTDSIREWAYDRNSHVGRLDMALDEAEKQGWTVVDMERDWKYIFPFEMKESQ